ARPRVINRPSPTASASMVKSRAARSASSVGARKSVTSSVKPPSTTTRAAPRSASSTTHVPPSRAALRCASAIAPEGTAMSTSALARLPMASRTAPPTRTASRPPASAATRSSAACAGSSWLRRSSAMVEQARGVVVEDLAADDVGQRAVPRPAALLVVVVWNQRKVGTEQDAILPADQRGVGDRARIGADVARGGRGQRHRRVHVDVRMCIEQRQERVALEGAHVRDDRGQPRKAREQTAKAPDPGERITVRQRADVQDEDVSGGLGSLVHAEQALVVDVKTLDRVMEFESAQAERPSGVGRDGLD